MKYVLSFGGGLNSSALLVWIIENKKPLDLVLFADTGGEFPHTYNAVKFYKQYCADRNIRFEIVKSSLSKSLYTYMWDKKIVPSKFRRDCTSKFKISPMRRYMRSLYGKQEKFTQYIGIDYSEAHRVMTNDVQYITNCYPLVDNKIDREECKQILEEKGLLIPEKSGCYFCMFTSRKNWLKLLDEHPSLYESSMKLEQHANRYPHSNALLHSIPLLKLKNNKTGNTKIDEFLVLPSCDVAGSCFL